MARHIAQRYERRDYYRAYLDLRQKARLWTQSATDRVMRELSTCIDDGNARRSCTQRECEILALEYGARAELAKAYHERTPATPAYDD